MLSASALKTRPFINPEFSNLEQVINNDRKYFNKYISSIIEFLHFQKWQNFSVDLILDTIGG